MEEDCGVAFELICLVSNIRKEVWVDANYNGSKMARVLIPKVHINEKINMEKNVKNQC
jgi:hypothetical protein